MPQPTVLITDAVDPVCERLLKEHGFAPNVQLKASPDELKEHAKNADGWIVRSGTKITPDLIDAAEKLKVIGRAGVGVDNIDLEAATRRGILVCNAPDGNTISTAEHACAMLQALARRIPQASASLRAGKWERKQFAGSELHEKTLGIVGVGKIGRAVAQRMQGFEMTLLGFDPMLSEEVAARYGVTLVSLDELLQRSDFITLHTPLNDATRGLLNKEALAKCKEGVRIVNCARGGIVDEGDLLEVLETGHVGGAALDVYSTEPPPEHLAALVQHPRVVATPHIAASTEEAQAKVARQITEQVMHALSGEAVTSPVNGMAIKMAAQDEVQPFLLLADRLGQIAGQLAEGQTKRLTVRCHGERPHRYAEVLTVAALKGTLGRWADTPANLINAPVLAEEMGLAVREERGAAPEESYTHLVEVEVETSAGRHTVAGTVFNGDDPRLVRVDAFRLEVRPEGRLLFYRNEDRPGMLATVGGLLAENGINIAALALGRTGRGSMALTAISVDDPIPADVVEEIKGIKGLEGVRTVSFEA